MSDDLFDSFRDEPTPLAPAETVRARGDQRRRRERALFVGTGALVAVALAGTAALAVGGGSDRESITPPLATPTVPVAPTVSPTAPAPRPSTSTAPASSPPSSASTARLVIPQSALPPASALDSTSWDGWVRWASSRNDATTQSPFDLCGRDVDAPAAGRTGFLSGSYRVEDPATPGQSVPEGPSLYDEIVRYGTAEQAQAAYDELADTPTPRTCTSEVTGGLVSTYEVISTAPLVVEKKGGDSLTSLYPFPTYIGMVRVGNLLATFEHNPGETADRAGALRMAGLVEAALERAAQAG